jgi:hypothetical protein
VRAITTLKNQGFDPLALQRAAECGAEDVVVVLDDNPREYTLRCVVRRRPIYEDGGVTRLPDAPSGAVHLVSENVECFVDGSPGTRTLLVQRVRAALSDMTP